MCSASELVRADTTERIYERYENDQGNFIAELSRHQKPVLKLGF